jgi:putative flippase GtrA
MALLLPKRREAVSAGAAPRSGRLAAGKARLVEIAHFAAASAAGLAIDFLLFLLLLSGGAAAGPANLASGTVAVSFVYFASVRRIFGYRGDFLLGLFSLYLLYQAASVAAASWAVAAIIAAGIPPIAAKLAILPVSFPANYLFMAFLTGRRRAIAQGTRP